ncbi:GNAT family N-acetyltransferase [Granulibacter bethesdensis]|uniref:GNAT family N-acetyltransferase n=1 Tax=Granulibacter bethesdensis TaxID=364410 RepID=UPI0003F1D7BC|nr:GNAT family N-acetyltransferase [Granulibacter bethesdensis]AHJ66914.1 N(6)-hydroxylysine O-acetyltransferase [Granulibacter bethesdensis CGDNIH4]
MSAVLEHPAERPVKDVEPVWTFRDAHGRSVMIMGRGELSILLNGSVVAHTRLHFEGELARAIVLDWSAPERDRNFLIYVLADYAFSEGADCFSVSLESVSDPADASFPLHKIRDNTAFLYRQGHRQQRDFWQAGPPAHRQPLLRRALPDGRDHPLRPPAPKGVFYRRRDTITGHELTLRALDIGRDLELFHMWQNQPRVAKFWDEAGPIEKHEAYLRRMDADPHAFSVIGELDGEPSTYFEIYWGKEDRLGPHYEADDYDRGWHVLVGEKRHLGRDRTLAWFRAITHCLFLDDCRTRKVVGEPSAAHSNMLRLCEESGYTLEYEFDFPHKRSMLITCTRDHFFRECIR